MRFARGKGQAAVGRGVVGTGGGRAVGGGEVDSHRLFAGANFGHREGHRACSFVNDDVAANVERRTIVVGGAATRQGAPVINNGRYLRAVAYLGVGRRVQLDAEVLSTFKYGVVGDVDRNRLARLARRKAQRAARCIVVGSGDGRAVYRAKGNARGQIGGTGLGHREGDRAGRFVNNEVAAHVEDRTVVVGGPTTRQAAAVINNGAYPRCRLNTTDN